MTPLVFHLRASNFFGGPERQMLGHARNGSGFRHMVVTFQEGGQKNEFQKICKEQGVAVVGIPCRNAYQWSTLTRLNSCIAEYGPSILCCHGYRPLVLAVLGKRRHRLPIIAFSRGHTDENLKIKIFEFIERQLYSHVQRVVAVSEGNARRLTAHGLAKEKISVVHNVIDTGKFLPFLEQRQSTREELGFAPDDFVVATAGRLSPEKAQGVLIEAFAWLKRQFPKAHLLVCGDGPLRRQLEEQAKNSGTGDIRFLGHRKDLDRLMPSFDLFVLPSLTEGFPNVLLEAAACRVPIVATRVGGVPEIIDHGKTGWLVDAGDVMQLSDTMAQAVAREDLRIRNAESAYSLVMATYTFASQTRQLEAVYENILQAESR